MDIVDETRMLISKRINTPNGSQCQTLAKSRGEQFQIMNDIEDW